MRIAAYIIISLIIVSFINRKIERRKHNKEVGAILGNIVSIIKQSEEEFNAKMIKINTAISSNEGKIPTKEIYDLIQENVNRDGLGRLDCSDDLKFLLMEFKNNHANVFTKEELELDDLR